MKGNKIMSQQKMKFRFIAFFLAAVFALTMISLPVWAEDGSSEEGGSNTAELEQQLEQVDWQQLRVYSQAPSPENLTLYGDIRIGNDTEHSALHEVVPGEVFTFTGLLDVEPIKDQIKSLAAGYEKVFALIGLSGVESTFNVTLTLPKGLKFSDESLNYYFTENPNNIFKVTKCEINGQLVTVTMDLKDKSKYTNFKILYDDVTNCPNLAIDIPGITVDPQIPIGSELTTMGTVTGNFKGTATSPSGQKILDFPFNWTAIQYPDGKDFKFKDNQNYTDISYTVIVVEPAPEEEQDIVIPCPYPCQVPPMWNPPQVIQQVQPMPQAPVQNVDAAQAQAPIQLPKTGEKSTQPLSLFFLLSASALFLLRRKMR